MAVLLDALRGDFVPDVALVRVRVEVADVARNREQGLQPVLRAACALEAFDHRAFDELVSGEYAGPRQLAQERVVVEVFGVPALGLGDVCHAVVLQQDRLEGFAVVLRDDQSADLVRLAVLAVAEALQAEVVDESDAAQAFHSSSDPAHSPRRLRDSAAAR